MPFLFYGSADNGVLRSATKLGAFFVGAGGGILPDTPASHAGVGLFVTALAGLALAAAVFYGSRGRLRSPWYRRRRKNALSPAQWRSFFTQDGRLDDAVKFLKKVRSGGVDPSLRAEVWPFLLGVYELNSTEEERKSLKSQRSKEYEKLRRRCRELLKCNSEYTEESGENSDNEDSGSGSGIKDTNCSDADNDIVSTTDSPSAHANTDADAAPLPDSTEESQSLPPTDDDMPSIVRDSSSKTEEDIQSKLRLKEDFATWQRIIRLDAIRANDEWISYSPTQTVVSQAQALRAAKSVCLKDHEHLEPYRMFHAARLVAILDAYAVYDAEIGYCQGMSDLLSPIIAVVTEDEEAFWCFVGFMRKARHNFRLDEVGIRRQLNRVSNIIRCKDTHLYRHLEKLEAEDCFFVYRMVVVLFRRELTFEQTICLWEVMWADQAAIRAGIGKSSWSRIRLRAPPTEDLLLYAIAASVLQRRKLIIENYNSMDEIIRECNNMSGHLDVWKLLDDAYDLVVTLHNKIETPF
jgi:hypothetical protein